MPSGQQQEQAMRRALLLNEKDKEETVTGRRKSVPLSAEKVELFLFLSQRVRRMH
mgnify:CR=1 FL=1